MALKNIPNLCLCSALGTSVPCKGLGEAALPAALGSLAPSLWETGDAQSCRACDKGGLSSGWGNRKYTKSKWIKRSGFCKNIAKFWRSYGSCTTWLSRHGYVWLPVPVQSCCSVIASSGVTFKFCTNNWKELVVFQRLLSSSSSTEAQLVLPPPGEWFLLTVLTKDQGESWYHLIEPLVGGPWEMI